MAKAWHPWKSLLTVLLAVPLAACGPGREAELQPSGHAVTVPEAGTPFTRYLATAREHIRLALQQGPFAREEEPFGPGYTLEKVVDMRAPWQMGPAGDCTDQEAGTEAFLFVHGLSDSPYTLRALAQSLSGSRPCALIRSVLLPGHGTVPGDLLDVSRDAWRDTVRYAVERLPGNTETLYLVGYSTGAALVIEQADARRDDERLTGLILLSPALDLDNPLAWLAPLLRRIRPWLNVAPDRDAAKYESFPLNTAAETHLMLRELAPLRMPPLSLPVFMVSSADDTTVDPVAARDFFCKRTPAQRRHMIWYQSPVTAQQAVPHCEGLRIRPSASPPLRTVTHSHVGITLPPDDEHYGVDGRYRHCLRYGNDPALHQRCLEDNQTTVYGEPARLAADDGLYGGQPVRRTTFNPFYSQMLQSLDCFLDDGCQP